MSRVYSQIRELARCTVGTGWGAFAALPLVTLGRFLNRIWRTWKGKSRLTWHRTRWAITPRTRSRELEANVFVLRK